MENKTIDATPLIKTLVDVRSRLQTIGKMMQEKRQNRGILDHVLDSIQVINITFEDLSKSLQTQDDEKTT